MVNKLYEKSYLKKKTTIQPLYLFIIDGAGAGNSFLTKSLYQSFTKIFSYKNSSLDKTKVSLLTLTGVVTDNVDGTATHSALDIPVGYFGGNLSDLSDKMN